MWNEKSVQSREVGRKDPWHLRRRRQCPHASHYYVVFSYYFHLNSGREFGSKTQIAKDLM